MKNALVLLGLLLAGQWSKSKSECPPPQLKVLIDQKEITKEGSAFSPNVVLALHQDAACAANKYEVTGADLALVRNKRLVVPVKTTASSSIDLSAWQKLYQPGDLIYIEVKSAVMVDANGKKQPYSSPATAVWALK